MKLPFVAKNIVWHSDNCISTTFLKVDYDCDFLSFLSSRVLLFETSSTQISREILWTNSVGVLNWRYFLDNSAGDYSVGEFVADS